MASSNEEFLASAIREFVASAQTANTKQQVRIVREISSFAWLIQKYQCCQQFNANIESYSSDEILRAIEDVDGVSSSMRFLESVLIEMGDGCYAVGEETPQNKLCRQVLFCLKV